MSDYVRESAEKVIERGSEKEVCDAILSITFNEVDWRWVQDKLLILLSSPSASIRGVSATCLGHLARIHGRLDKEKVMLKLSGLLADECISGQVESAIEDIDMFL